MFTTNHSIKFWAEDDRPREKMLLKGRNSLSDAELLAILIGTGTKSMSALGVAQEILSFSDKCLSKLGRLTLDELKTIPGIGDAKAVTIAAALELGRRRKESAFNKREKINASKQVYQLVSPYFQDLVHEEFRVIALNNSCIYLGIELVSIGGMTGTIVDSRILFKKLIDLRATNCILCHNHPSGSLYPSDADISLTKKLVEIGKLIGIQVLDHLIITDSGYYSFSDEGRMI
jgi:DNA repair protein RadC